MSGLRSIRLFEGPSGAELKGSADQDVLVWDAATERWHPEAVAPGGVTSVFGRVGAVVAAANDYDTDQIENLSGVAGLTSTDALNALLALASAASAAALAAAASALAAQQPFKATYYINPAFVGTSTGSQAAPFTTIAAAFAAALAAGYTGGTFFIPPGVTVTENVVFPPTGGIWEIVGFGFAGSTTGSRVVGTVTCDVTSGSLIAKLNNLIVTGNTTGLANNAALAFYETSVRQNGSITLTTAGTGTNSAAFRGIGPAFASKPGGSNTLHVSVAGQITAENWVFEGGFTEAPATSFTPYPGSTFRQCQLGSTNGTAVTCNLNGLTLNAWFYDCICSGPLTLAAGVANYVVYMDGSTLSALGNAVAGGPILTGTNIRLKTINGQLSATTTVAGNVASTVYGARSPAGMYQVDFSLTLLATGTLGALQFSVIYTDATGTLVTAAVGLTLNIAGAVGSKLSGSLLFEHNGAAAPIAFSFTGVTTPGAMSVSHISSFQRRN